MDKPKVKLWNNPSFRAKVYQALILLGVVSLFAILFTNTQENLEKQNIASGFDFLTKESSFEIGETVIEYSAENDYLRALIVGLLNTVKVSFFGIIFSVLFGTLVGIARISKNWPIKKMAIMYIEGLRNIPLLLQLFFWYSLITETLPSVRKALNPFEGVFLSNRGLYYPALNDNSVYTAMGISALVVLFVGYFLKAWNKKRQDETGLSIPVYTIIGLSLLFLPTLVWLVSGMPIDLNYPELQGFNFEGGNNISPELSALLLGLVLYTSAFIAEIIRSGIESVDSGQTEAGLSVGLKQTMVLRLIVLPQALRVAIPPMTSQMLNLTKNSSLAVAIGYPDFVSIANTTMNQTGQAIESVGLIMLVYLTCSLSTSIFMNWYNKKKAIVER